MHKKIVVFFVFLLAVVEIRSIPLPENLQPEPEVSEDDVDEAATGFDGGFQGGGGSGKFFQYTHVPAKGHYEDGHKRGNEHHFIEKHEKAHPHDGEFKTKVRWGDKHGGYGEHLWDYNHAGGHVEDGETDESQAAQVEQDSVRPEALILPPYDYVKAGDEVERQTGRNKRHRKVDTYSPDVEFIDENSRYEIQNGNRKSHGGNYMTQADYTEKAKQKTGHGKIHRNSSIKYGPAKFA